MEQPIPAASELEADLIKDLLRSSWIIESARAAVYREWTPADETFEASRRRAEDRASLLEAALGERGKQPDAELVEPHAVWIRSLVGTPGEVALGNLFLARLGDWVDGHTAGFMPDGGAALRALGDEERGSLSWPSEFPAPPPFEPLPPPQGEPPGDVELRIAVLGDLHIGSTRAELMARAAIADINAAGVDLVVQLGDITDHGQIEEFHNAADVLGDLDAELVTMIGNHDVYSVSETKLMGRDYYPSVFGRAPDGVLLERKGFHIAVLDSAEHLASPFAPFDLASGAFLEGPGGAIVRGALTPPQHEILAEVAGPDAPPAFVFLHHPPQPFAGFPPILFGLREADAGRLHAVIDSGNVWGVFAGHTHRNARTRDYGKIPAQEVGIPRDFPFGFAILDIARQGYTYRFLQISDLELLRDAYGTAGDIHRRYGLGPADTRSFSFVA
ncbi:MAG TPA: metallophosphoesterase [Actinomycetota bacterium]|nr:metallophosphoesterase [Actinomycetota bacterium]